MNPTIVFLKPELRIDVVATGLVVAVQAVKPSAEVSSRRGQVRGHARPEERSRTIAA
jgi:hypothetical protein